MLTHNNTDGGYKLKTRAIDKLIDGEMDSRLTHVSDFLLDVTMSFNVSFLLMSILNDTNCRNKTGLDFSTNLWDDRSLELVPFLYKNQYPLLYIPTQQIL